MHFRALGQTWYESYNRTIVPYRYAGIDTYAEQAVCDFELLPGRSGRVRSLINNNSTALRMQDRGVVSIFGAGYPGCDLAAWVPNAPKMEGESKGGDFPSWHTTFGTEWKKSSVLYLLSRLARERGGAIWRRHFPAPGNQVAGWSTAIIPPPDFGRDKRYIKPPSLVPRPAAATVPVG